MNKDKLKKIYLIVLAIYVALVTSFYFLAGEQLWYKKSTAHSQMQEADMITEEINKKQYLSQIVNCPVDRLESMELVFTKNYQEGSGDVTFYLFSGSKILANEHVSVKDIPEQHRVHLTLNKPQDNMLNKPLRITVYSTSEEGQGIFGMMNSKEENSSIKINSEEFNGSLCYSILGSDEVSIAPYYWFIVGGVGLSLAIGLFISYNNYKKGKHDYIIVLINAIDRYKFLISQLVSRDFKTKYKRSIFGVFWSFLNPLLTMIVQFLVFSTFFKADTKNYPVYLISGVVCFSFFSECSSKCLESISGNYRLITKVYIPKYIFPLAKTLSSSVNLLISLVPMLLVAIVTGTALHWSFLLMFYFLVMLVIFSLGIGMILATLMVFFRDIQFLWSVICTIWQYATPIFYPAEIIPEKYRFIVKFNPLYHFIGNLRKCLIDGISPDPSAYLYCFIFAFGALAIGSFIFKKAQDKFTLYL